jgi:hypothetical protein
MPRPVTYHILDLPDGRFAVAATIGGASTHVRTDLKTRAEADDAIDELRHIMTALGAPLICAAPEHSELPIEGSIPARI